MITANYSQVLRTDGNLAIGMVPATNIGGWGLRFTVYERWLATSGVLQKTCASGFAGSGNLSGIVVTNSGNGQFNIPIRAQDTSGLNSQVYVYDVWRTDSGYVTPLVQGNFVLKP